MYLFRRCTFVGHVPFSVMLYLSGNFTPRSRTLGPRRQQPRRRYSRSLQACKIQDIKTSQAHGERTMRLITSGGDVEAIKWLSIAFSMHNLYSLRIATTQAGLWLLPTPSRRLGGSKMVHPPHGMKSATGPKLTCQTNKPTGDTMFSTVKCGARVTMHLAYT